MYRYRGVLSLIVFVYIREYSVYNYNVCVHVYLYIYSYNLLYHVHTCIIVDVLLICRSMVYDVYVYEIASAAQ